MRDEQYIDAIESAKGAYQDLKDRGDDALGGDVMSFLNSVLTPEEKAERDLKIELIRELIQARREKGISQKKLEELSGVRQPIIARMEKGTTSPQVDTLLKVLIPLGKTLAVVPIESADNKIAL